MSKKAVDTPFDLLDHIQREQRETCESNSCDYKPTYQPELDEIDRKARERYAAGLKVIEKISADDKARLIRLCNHSRGNSYGTFKLCSDVVDNVRILAPRWVFFLGELKALRAAIA